MQTSANLFSRVVAFAIDFIIYRIFVSLINDQFHGIRFHELPPAEALEKLTLILWVNMALVAIAIFAYFALCEGILLRATIGKMVMKLRVVDMNGTRITFRVALVRSIYKMLPFVLMMCVGVVVYLTEQEASLNALPNDNIGVVKSVSLIAILAFAVVAYGLVFLNDRKQTLHDRMAKTMVIKTDEIGLLEMFMQKGLKWLAYLRKAGIPK